MEGHWLYIIIFWYSETQNIPMDPEQTDTHLGFVSWWCHLRRISICHHSILSLHCGSPSQWLSVILLHHTRNYLFLAVDSSHLLLSENLNPLLAHPTAQSMESLPMNELLPLFAAHLLTVSLEDDQPSMIILPSSTTFLFFFSFIVLSFNP